MSTLVVVRHAKAEQFGPADHERALTERGLADAAAAGRWLAGQGIAPATALVSTALRTRQTWSQLAQAAGWDLEPWLDSSLYAADPDTVLDLLRALPDEPATVVLVGHNPTMAYLAQLLDDGTSGRLMGEFATSAIAVLSYDGGWADLDAGSCRLADFHLARG
ncbi:SixA phosphatase family protein [Nocardioides sp.]|uniref:SixA phosphatase family protein n=1 Tax=Nocardioides sp. TaxID=35761 RepID=UPI0039E258A3